MKTQNGFDAPETERAYWLFRAHCDRKGIGMSPANPFPGVDTEHSRLDGNRVTLGNRAGEVARYRVLPGNKLRKQWSSV